MLLEQFDPNKRAVIDPEMVFQPVEGMPKVLVSCFAAPTFARMVQGLDLVEVACPHSANMGYPIYRTQLGGATIGFMMAPVGAPLCVGVFEEAFALGAETAVVFGNCGVLDKAIADCAIIVPTSALRDEGTSCHYAPPGDEIAVNARYREVFAAILTEYGVSSTAGKAWTTDAFFRETPDKVAARKAAGCVCVDMECSALAALAQFRGKEVFQFFYAGDNLDAEAWDQRSLSANSLLEEKDRAAQLAIALALRIAQEKNDRDDDRDND